MGRFNKEEFGNRIREARKAKGYTLENLANAIHRGFSAVAKYERGEVLPDAETISLICDELGISEYELFDSTEKINNIDNSKNPFGVKTLYLYYRAYFPTSKKFGKGKFKLKIIEKSNCCKVDFVDYKTDKIYMSGHILADGNIAVFVLENYKPNSPRLEVTEIILNIANGMDRLMVGTLYCTNGKYVPSIRKCIVSKIDLEYTEEIEKQLEISETDKQHLIDENVLYVELENKDDFEE